MTRKDYELISNVIANVRKEFRGVEDGTNACRDGEFIQLLNMRDCNGRLFHVFPTI